MLFSRVVSFFAFSLTLGGLVGAVPAAQTVNSTSVRQVVIDLKSSTDTIVPQLKELAQNNKATDATVAPLIGQLIQSVNNAQIALLKAKIGISGLDKRQDVTDIAALLANIIEEISTVVDTLLTSSTAIPILGALLPGLDAALTSLVASLGAVVAGLVVTVSGLLTTVSTLLEGLGLGLLLNILGLVAGL